MRTKTQKIVLSALLAALAFAATLIIKIPSPFKGYINLGDCVVLTAGWILSPLYGFLAAGIGSMIADIYLGYMTYAPVTFVIKGLMAVLAHYIFKGLYKKTGDLWGSVISGLCAEVLMVLGYFVFEGFLYGFIPSLVNIPLNGFQGIAGLITGVLLVNVLKKNKIFS